MLALYIYLGICAAIFCWFMLLGIRDFLFQPTYKNIYESHSFRNRLFWREALWMSLPGVNLIVLVIFLYVIAIGYRENSNG
jgi:hypothetical protein